VTVNWNYFRARTKRHKGGMESREKGKRDTEKQCYNNQAVSGKYFFSHQNFEFDIET